MREDIVRFWRGELPLGDAFWRYAVLYGIGAHVAGLVLLLALHLVGVPMGVAWAVSQISTLFSVFTLIGVWRSADRFGGRAFWADLAKIGAVFGAVVGVPI